MRRKELHDLVKATVKPLYGETEARSIANLFMEGFYGLRREEIVLYPDHPIEISQQIEQAIEELGSARPIQYVLGWSEFCGMRLAVEEGVLVPRPETEELVEWVVGECGGAATILDIGTGSGAIAIALSKRVDGASVTGVDISGEALRIAQKNALDNGVAVEFLEVDVLSPIDSWVGDWVDQSWDVIVSNPPYIPKSDKKSMHPNVLEYEPHEALFVEDNDPLIFYRKIAQDGKRLLKSGGSLFFEIYEEFGEKIVEMMERMDYGCVELREDINGRKRVVRCRKR